MNVVGYKVLFAFTALATSPLFYMNVVGYKASTRKGRKKKNVNVLYERSGI